MNRFVNDQDIFEDVTQDMADIQTDEAHNFAKVARQNMDSGSDSDNKSYVEDIVEVIHYSIKSLQSRDHVEQITLSSTRRETNETGSSRLHPYRLEDEQITGDDIPSELENQDNNLSLNNFVNELDPKSFESVTQGIVEEQTAVTTNFAKVAQLKMDIGSESDEESYITEVRRYSFKSLQSVNQVEQINLRASSQTNETVGPSSLHPYSLTIMDDWSEDDIPAELENQGNDSMNSFVNEFVQRTLEGVKQEILHTKDDIPSELENQDNDSMNSFVNEPVQKTLEGVKQDILHTEDDIPAELENQDNDSMNSFVNKLVQKTLEGVKQDILHTDDIPSELQNHDNDLSVNSFVNEFVQNVIKLAMRNIAVEQKAKANVDISFAKATQQEMDQERLSSINMMIQSMNQVESAKLPSASETNVTMDTHISLIPSDTDKCVHTANSSAPPWKTTRARSDPCLKQLLEHNRVALHKALSDTNVLQARHVSPIIDFLDIQFLKVNSSIAEAKIVNQRPIIQSGKPGGADLTRIPINTMPTTNILSPVDAPRVDIPLVTVTPGAISIPSLHTTPTIVTDTDNVSATIDKTNDITSAIVDIPSTSATPVIMSNIQVPCNDTKKSSIVKRARIRVSYAFRRMTRLLTACSSGRESTKKSQWRPSKQHSAINMEDDSQPTA